MAILLTMPSLSPTMETGVIGSWNKKEGDFIDVGEVLAEVETDKAVMDYEMVDEGYVRKFLVAPGVEVPVGAPIAILAESLEEDISAVEAQAASGQPAAGSGNGGGLPAAEPPPAAGPAGPPPAAGAAPPTAAPQTAAPQTAASQTAAPPTAAPQTAAAAAMGEAPAPMPPTPAPPLAPPPAVVSPPAAQGAGNGGRVSISPYGKKIAEQHQLDWRALTGSGPGGRIIAADVEAALAGAAAAPVSPPRSGSAEGQPGGAVTPGALYQELPLSMMRKAIARKMEESKRTVPHFQATRKVRVEKLVAAREAVNREFPGETKISLNDMIVKACAVALLQHPMVNSQFLGDHIRLFNTVEISVAVGTADGLITPVLRAVERKGLREISAEIRALAARAREKKLSPEEYSGGTFTISNLGMYGITEFNGIINTPQACLLAVSGIMKEPVVEGDALVAGQTMNLTLSSDHRVVDGLTAAQFLDTLTKILENPVAMVL